MNPMAVVDAKLAELGIVELPELSREERANFMLKLLEVVEASRNVVAQWRGDISRKPHIGRLRTALTALDEARSTSARKDG